MGVAQGGGYCSAATLLEGIGCGSVQLFWPGWTCTFYLRAASGTAGKQDHVGPVGCQTAGGVMVLISVRVVPVIFAAVFTTCWSACCSALVQLENRTKKSPYAKTLLMAKLQKFTINCFEILALLSFLKQKRRCWAFHTTEAVLMPQDMSPVTVTPRKLKLVTRSTLSLPIESGRWLYPFCGYQQ